MSFLARVLAVIVLALVLTMAFALGSAGEVWAGVAEREAAYDAHIVEELRKKSPEAADHFREAAEAATKDDLARAAALYEKVNALVPDHTPAMRRRAVILVHLGRRAEAIELARRARALEDTRENRTSLALVLVTPAGKMTPSTAERNEGLGLARRVTDDFPSDPDFQRALCHVALRAQSAAELESSAAALLRVVPDEPESHVCASLAAAMRGDRDAARTSLATARRLGLDPAMADDLSRAIDDSEPPLFRWGKRLLAVSALWLAGLGLLFAIGGALSSATLRLVRRLSPDPNTRGEGALLRSLYRAVLHVASVYYYVSLPLVLVLSIVLGVGILLGFLYIGRIPVYLVLVVFSIVVFTVISVVKSIFIRVRDADPGTPVDLQKHPRLAAVIQEVAARVGTRVVDGVYLTPHTDIAVLERGGMLRQLRGTTERCLVLGVGVLDGMKLGSFKAVLAHEYGHFSNRDTAGGGVALSVRRSVLLTALGLAQRGAATWYNPAWLFIVGFHKIFLRISQGASRLQEVMADRIAAFAYGPETFARGLSHVVRRSIEFDAHVNATIGEVIDKSRPLANLYCYEPEKKAGANEIEAAVAEAMDREPSPYDSHPKPADRIRWVRELATSTAPSAEDESDVWTLFASRAEIEDVMTAEVRARLAEQGVSVRAEVEAAA